MKRLSKKTRLVILVGFSLVLVLFGYDYWFVSPSDMNCGSSEMVEVRNRLDHKQTKTVQGEACRFLPRVWERYTPTGQYIQSQPCGCALDAPVVPKT